MSLWGGIICCIRQIANFLWSMSLADCPVIVILGSTGVGKSKLALEVAEHCGGEIISADSMQIYKGLDVFNNKVTKEEQRRVPHHMINVAEPAEDFTVVKFRDQCLNIISELQQRRKLPIIVGGTNYYIESVLWNVLVSKISHQLSDGDNVMPLASNSGPAHSDSVEVDVDGDTNRQKLEALSTECLYQMLKEQDPDHAGVLHPKERRKILRALEVMHQTGVPISEVWRRQRDMPGGGRLGGPLRFQRVLLFWLTADQDVLDVRLDQRVDDMVVQGLPELVEFHQKYNADRINSGEAPDYSRGIFQSIGFKEFHGYLTREGDSHAAQLLQESIERLKLVTRRYARKQTRWVRRRLLSADSRQLPPVYRLDTTDPAQWSATVGTPAVRAVRAWLAGQPVPLVQEQLQQPRPQDGNTVYHCSVCDVHLSGAHQREQHFLSGRHKKAVAGLARRQQRATVLEENVPANKDARRALSAIASR